MTTPRPATQSTSASGRSPGLRDERAGQRRGWTVPAGLVALSVIPLSAGSLRLVQLAGGPDLIPPDDRFTGFPAALLVHIVGAASFAPVGAFQFVPRFRRHHRTWHRRAGHLVTGAGLAVAASALWLTLCYETPPGTGELRMDLAKGSGWVINLAIAEWAIRRPARQRNRHHPRSPGTTRSAPVGAST